MAFLVGHSLATITYLRRRRLFDVAAGHLDEASPDAE
jgi:hypothetical protein